MKKIVIIFILAHIIILLCLILFCENLQVSGTSMEPTLNKGDKLLVSDVFGFQKGDIIAFYYNDFILIRRVIASQGDVVNITYDGTVYVNSSKIEENYTNKFALGNNCNITFPYKVPENNVFVLGDNREKAIDSRNQLIGCISQQSIIGKILVIY